MSCTSSHALFKLWPNKKKALNLQFCSIAAITEEQRKVIMSKLFSYYFQKHLSWVFDNETVTPPDNHQTVSVYWNKTDWDWPGIGLGGLSSMWDGAMVPPLIQPGLHVQLYILLMFNTAFIQCINYLLLWPEQEF